VIKGVSGALKPAGEFFSSIMLLNFLFDYGLDGIVQKMKRINSLGGRIHD
jgi:hypothetical protein